MRRLICDFQFINILNLDERVFLLKLFDKLKELLDNLFDIEFDNFIKCYQRRLKQLENICLVYFVVWFNCVCESFRDVLCIRLNDFVLEIYFDDNNDDDIYNIIDDISVSKNEYNMRGGIKFVKRCRFKIICFIRFYKDRDLENFYREQFMFYILW